MNGDIVLMLSLGLQRGASVRSVYRRGLRLCVVDVYPFLSPHNLSDYWCAARSADCGDLMEAITQVVAVGEVCGVVTFREHLVVPAAQLALRLELPGLMVRAAAGCRNKATMRKLWSEAGLIQPRWQIVTAENVRRAIAEIVMPAVIKPVDGTAGSGVAVLEGRDAADDLRMAEEAVAASAQGQAIVEDYVQGPEFSVELVLYDGEVRFAMVTGKDVAGCPACIEVGHTVPAPVSPADRRLLIDTAVRAATVMAVDRGVAHVELKITSEGPLPLEIAARPAADHIPELVYEASGVDLYGAAIDIALGVRPELQAEHRGAAAIAYKLSQPGTVIDVSGVDKLFARPEVIWAQSLVRPGDQISCRSNHDRSAVVMVRGDEPEMARQRAQKMLDRVVIGVQPGECKT